MTVSEVVGGTSITTAKAGEIKAGITAPTSPALGDTHVKTNPALGNRPIALIDAAMTRQWETDIGLRCIYADDTITTITSTTINTDIVTVTISLNFASTQSYFINFNAYYYEAGSAATTYIGLKLNGTVVNATTSANRILTMGGLYTYGRTSAEIWLPYHATAGKFGMIKSGPLAQPTATTLVGADSDIPTSITSFTLTGQSTLITTSISVGCIEIWEVF